MAELTNVYGAYWGLGYWLSSVRLIKMMQCAVTRRRVPGRKKANILHGSRSPGLATLIAAKDQQEEQVVAMHSHHLPVRLLKSQAGMNGSSSLGIEAPDDSRVADGANVADGHSEQAYGEGNLITGPLQRVCLAYTGRHFPYSEVAAIREARRASLKRKMVVRKPKSSPLSPFARQRVVPEMLTADDTTGKFAYISLDGRLINAELATSASNIGGGLGAEETQAWEDFSPMYRVLIVALSAAASSAAKDKNSIEIQRLLKIVTEQEKELVHMRQQLSDHLCFQTITDPGNLDSRTELLEWASPTDAGEASLQNLKSPVHSELRCVEDEEAVESVEVPDAEFPNDSPFKLSSGDLEKTRDDPINKSIVLVVTPLGKDLTGGIFRSLRDTNSLFEKSAHDEAKWYVNPMVDVAEDYYDMQTPARDNPIFSTCTPAIRRSFGRIALRSSVKKRDKWTSDPRLSPLAELVPASPLQVIPCRLSKKSITPSIENINVDEEVTALRVQCVAALLKLKTKVMTVLRKEGAKCVAERNIRATEGKALVASLLSAVAGCWRETVPQALAALGLSPSEHNSCLLSSTQRTKTNDSECARDTDFWRQYLEEHDISEQEAEQKSSRVAALCLCASNFQQLSVCKSFKNNRLSEGSSEREHVNLLGALEADEESTCSSVNVGVLASESRGCIIHEESSAESQSKFVHCWENPSEWLDKASTEVADMEMQIKLLQLDVSEFEAERDKSESNLIESFHLENQAKLHHTIVDLGTRLKMKGVQFAERLGSPKSRLREVVETVDLAELRRELELKESKISELTCIVQGKDDLIADMESNMHADLEDMARELQSQDYKILELKSEVQLKGLEVAGLERKLKAKLSVDVAEMSRQIQLIEAKFVELTTRLHMKDLVIADLEHAQKVLLMAKDKELSVLLEDRLRSDAQLHEVTAAVQATELAVSDRITTLEDLCSRKDFRISEMRHELQSLKFRCKPLQSPNMLRKRRSTISYIPREPHYVVEETSPPPTSTTNGPADPPCEDLHDTSDTEAGPPLPEGRPLVDVTSVSTSSERDDDVPSDAKVSGEILQNDKENVTETTGSSNPQPDRNVPASKTGARTAKQSTSNPVATKSKRATTDTSRNTTSSSANATGANRVRASMAFTSSGGAKHSSKSSSVAHPVVISKKLRRRVIISPVRGQKPLGAVLPNTPVNTKKNQRHCVVVIDGVAVDDRSEEDTKSQKHGDGAAAMEDRPKESSAVKRRRWAA